MISFKLHLTHLSFLDVIRWCESDIGRANYKVRPSINVDEYLNKIDEAFFDRHRSALSRYKFTVVFDVEDDFAILFKLTLSEYL